jgi:hypothetical protein
MMATVSLVELGDLRGLQRDIQNYPMNLKDRDYQGHSLTSIVIRENQPHILKWLLFHGGPTLQTKGIVCGRTPWYVLGYEFGISARMRKPTSNWKRRDLVAIFMLRIMLMQDQPSSSDWSYLQTQFPTHIDLMQTGYTLRNQFLDQMLDTTVLQAMTDFISGGDQPSSPKPHLPGKISVKKRIWKKLRKKQIHATTLRVS